MTSTPSLITVIDYIRVDGRLTERIRFEGDGTSPEADEAVTAAQQAWQAGDTEHFEVVTHKRRHIGGVCRCWGN